MSLGVKVMYIANLTIMFGGMVVVSYFQGTGALSCPSITVTFPDVSSHVCLVPIMKRLSHSLQSS
jgi:hypothetical protein